MAGQLVDKVVIVTGAARGLGRECARRLAAEQAAVVAADIRDCAEVVAEITAAGGRAVGMNLDVTDMRSCISMAQTAVESFGLPGVNYPDLSASIILSGAIGRKSPVKSFWICPVS